MLERVTTTERLLAGHPEALIVTGLGSAANDVAHVTHEHPRAFTMDGVMGAAVSVGLGVALAWPDREVMVVTGDGELLMNVGSLATVAMKNPGNLRIVVIDNGLYGLTGGQETAAATVTDLETMARGAGIARTLTIRDESQFPTAEALLASTEGTSLVVVKVRPGPSAEIRIERDGTVLRDRFRQHVLSTKSGA